MYSFQNMNGRAHKRAIYDGECARLVDPLTGNIIYNAAEVDRDVAANIAAFEETYGVQFHEHTLTKTQKAIKCTGHNSHTKHTRSFLIHTQNTRKHFKVT